MENDANNRGYVMSDMVKDIENWFEKEKSDTFVEPKLEQFIK